MPALLGLPIPNVTKDPTGHAYDDNYFVQSYWIWIIIIPGLFAVLQSLLLFTVFNYDSPVEMKRDNDGQRLLHLFRRIYKTETEAALRMEQIVVPANDPGSQEEQIGFIQSMTDPRFSRTTWIGIMTLTFAQLTGINGIMFYGSNIFAGGDISPFVAVCIIQGINLGATILSLIVQTFTGRRPGMISGMIICIIGLATSFVFEIPKYADDTYLLLCVGLFIIGFELGPGAVGWPYVAEICNPRGVTLATMANWFWTLVIAIIWPSMNKWMPDGKALLVFVGITFVGLVFFIVFMKETKGKSKDEIERMFRADVPTVYKRFDTDEASV